jgi:hypothetical protein
MSQGGRVIGDLVEDGHLPGLDQFPQAIATIQVASGDAFMAGMDRAIYVSAFAIMAMAVVSYFLIQDEVASGAVRHHEEEPIDLELTLEQVAD